MRANDEAVPEPLAERKYSGNFQTRIPSELHRQLAIEAAEVGVSLNRLVSLRLAVPLVALSRAPRPQEKPRAKARAAADGLRALSRTTSLGDDLTLKDLVNDGRR